MNKRIKNSKSVKETVGARLKQARGDRHTLYELCDLLNEHPLAPNTNKILLPDTLKQWEYGRNAVNIEWIPALCAVLNIDTGYLFGEYASKTREVADICAKTGLSETAVDCLQEIFRKKDTVSGSAKLMLLDAILEDDNFLACAANILYALHMVPNQSIVKISFLTESGDCEGQAFLSDSSEDLRRLYVADLQNAIFEFIKSQFQA